MDFKFCEPMNYIFLDIDGVLNNEKFLFNDEWKVNDLGERYLDHVDDANLKILADLCAKTDAKVVISSSWRHDILVDWDLDDEKFLFSNDLKTQSMLDKLYANGIKVVGLTESFSEMNAKLHINMKHSRDAEIFSYIMRHLFPNDRFVIFDDEPIDQHEWFKDHFIKTNFSTGLTEADAKRAEEMLR